MKLKISKYKYVELQEAKGKVSLLFTNSEISIAILKDFKVEIIEREIKRKWRKNKIKKEIYLIDCTIYGYNTALEFVGTFSYLIVKDFVNRFNFYKGRKKWIQFKKQLDAFTKNTKTSNFFKNK